MTSIYKYPFDVNDRVELLMPASAEILTVQMQHGRPCVWARVDPKEEPGIVVLRIFGTGHPIDDKNDMEYVGTFQMSGGALVFHVFEVTQ